MKIEKGKLIKLFFVAIGAIVLGAIGSGVWEVFLSDLFFNSTNLFLRMSSSVFKGYVDILHKNICNGTSELFSIFPYILIVIMICAFPWIAMFLSRRRWSNLEEKITGKGKSDKPLTSDIVLEKTLKYKKKSTYMLTFNGILLFCLSFAVAAADLYQYKASIFIEKSIEIVSPNLTQKEILSLRSLYRGIDGSKKFYSLERKLHEIADDNNLELPKFTSIK